MQNLRAKRSVIGRSFMDLGLMAVTVTASLSPKVPAAHRKTTAMSRFLRATDRDWAAAKCDEMIGSRDAGPG